MSCYLLFLVSYTMIGSGEDMCSSWLIEYIMLIYPFSLFVILYLISPLLVHLN